jgi:hypothetical protein
MTTAITSTAVRARLRKMASDVACVPPWPVI